MVLPSAVLLDLNGNQVSQAVIRRVGWSEGEKANYLSQLKGQIEGMWNNSPVIIFNSQNCCVCDSGVKPRLEIKAGEAPFGSPADGSWKVAKRRVDETPRTRLPSTLRPDGYTVGVTDNDTPQTNSHEFGHLLGLPHPGNADDAVDSPVEDQHLFMANGSDFSPGDFSKWVEFLNEALPKCAKWFAR